MSHPRVKTALIGVGRWGQNIARELSAQSEFAAYASKSEPPAAPPEVGGAKWRSVENIAADKDIAAVCIATPITTHATLARQMLEAGKHVMCEKPLAETSEVAGALASLAAEKNLTLMTGYVFLYHPAYAEMKQILATRPAARIECIWNKYGTFDESIEMNLLTHHLALFHDLLGMPNSAETLRREAAESECDKLDTRFSYESAECISRIDRVSSSKEHTITVSLKDGGILVWSGNALTLDGEVIHESTLQPLTAEIAAFLDACAGGEQAPTSGTFGAEVLKIHELLK